MIIENENEK